MADWLAGIRRRLARANHIRIRYIAVSLDFSPQAVPARLC